MRSIVKWKIEMEVFFSILSLAKSKLDLSSIDDEIEVYDWTKLDVYFRVYHRNLVFQTISITCQMNCQLESNSF